MLRLACAFCVHQGHKRALMNTTRITGWLVALAAGMFTASCGSSAPEVMELQPGVGTSTAGATATSPNAGSGAATAGSGAGTTSVVCGAMTCSNPAVSFLPTLKMFMPNAMLATPCCLPSGGCGWVGTGGECTAPPDKAMCPAPSIPGFSALTGCCIESSQTCGIDSSAIGLGCMAPMFGGGAPTRCDGTPVNPPATGAAGTSAGAAGATAGAAGAAGMSVGAAGDGAAGAAAGSGASGDGASGDGAMMGGSAGSAGSGMAAAGAGGS